MRSRAAYKLEELLERGQLLKPGMLVVDLGAAPGGWSQVLRRSLRNKRGDDTGRVLALDILDMPPIAGVEFIHGDFREPEALSRLETLLGGAQVDLVLSDMAPNMTGVDTVDQARAMYLSELARDFAQAHLKPGRRFPDQAVPGRRPRCVHSGFEASLHEIGDTKAGGLQAPFQRSLCAGHGQALRKQ